MKPYLIITIAVAAFGVGWTANGWYWKAKYEELVADYRDAVLKSREDIRLYEMERDSRQQEVLAHHATKKVLEDTKAKEILIEVIKYVENPAIVSCNLDAAFILHHNRGARNTTIPTSGTD